jgi:hypothetical protein
MIYTKKVFVAKKCVNCSLEFYPKSSLGKYCSQYCKIKSETNKRSNKPTIKVCNHCKKEFAPYTSLDKFCSANCRVDNLKSKRTKNWNKESVEKIKGKGNPCYRNGYSSQGTRMNAVGLREFQKNREQYINEIKEKYGFIFCERCKRSDLKLEAHHIIFRSEKPYHEHLHSKVNITMVCVSCHNWYHKVKSNRDQLVIDRELNKYFGDDVLDKQNDKFKSS